MEDKVVLALATTVLFVVLSKLISFATKPRLNLPPGPWTLPLIGSLHHLVSSESTHNVMRKLALKHGPLMQLWFGEVATVVVSSPEVAQEVLKSKDITFADRYLSAVTATFSFDGTDVTLSPYGDRWRQLRKIMTQELLTAARVRSYQRIREEEVARLVRDLAAAGGGAVNLGARLTKMTNDIVLRCSVGSRCKYADEYVHAVHRLIAQTMAVSLADLFPSSKLAQALSTTRTKALRERNKMERIIGQIIQERKDQYFDGDDESELNKQCFVDVLLKLQKDGGTPIQITDDIIVKLLMDIFAGGTDTSSTTMIWTMSELVRSPRVMAKAQAEVRKAFQGKSTLTESDVAQLSYLKMVLKEAFRLHCPLPLLAPRRCRETCKVMGYDVPEGTAVFVNVWAMCRDPNYWEDAEEFKPERFENKSVDYKGNNFEFLPFGSGRRICPGINLGLANMEFALASLLYHFDWKMPDGLSPKDLDMSEAPGIISAKRTGLNLCPVTYISSSKA